MEVHSGPMAVRWRRVAVTVAALSLLVFLLVFHRHQTSSDVCSNSSQLPHSTPPLSQLDALPLRTAVSLSNRSELDVFRRSGGDLRPSDSVAATAATTRGQQHAVRQQFVIHRCPTSYNITDPQDEWFRNVVVQRSPATSRVAFTEEILILTPICNSEQHLQRYFENLCSLAYPHRLISVVLGEDSSDDNTVQRATEFINDLSAFFKRLALVRLPDRTSQKVGNDRHDVHWQLERRRHLALSRNRLLWAALSHDAAHHNVKWVLWLDVDLRHVPRDLIRYLLSANQSLVVPNCLWKQDNGQTATFDRNTWRETRASRDRLRSLPRDALMLEGYADSKREFLNDLKAESDLVKLDGVGGCVLLVAADLHRSGLVFPPFVFDHHIETEGLAKLAARMGVQPYGLPSVNVIHS